MSLQQRSWPACASAGSTECDSEEMSSTPATRPVTGSITGAPVQANMCEVLTEVFWADNTDRLSCFEDRADPVRPHGRLRVGRIRVQGEPGRAARRRRPNCRCAAPRGLAIGQGDDHGHVHGVDFQLLQHGTGRSDEQRPLVDFVGELTVRMRKHRHPRPDMALPRSRNEIRDTGAPEPPNSRKSARAAAIRSIRAALSGMWAPVARDRGLQCEREPDHIQAIALSQFGTRIRGETSATLMPGDVARSTSKVQE